MNGRLTKAQRTAIRLARRGPLVRCTHGYQSATKRGPVAAATVNSLIARGRFAVARATPAGEPIEVCYSGTQIELPFHA